MPVRESLKRRRQLVTSQIEAAHDLPRNMAGEVECHRCKTRASIPLDATILKLEAALKYRSCRKGRHAPPVHMIDLTREREITPYPWTHPDEDDRR